MLVWIVLTIVGTALCQETNLTRKERWEADIRHQHDIFSQYYDERNFDALENLYTKDCVIMAPGTYAKGGRTAIRQLLSSLPGMGIDSLEVTTLEVTPVKLRTCAERGVLTFRKADGSIFGVNKYMVIWKRENKIPKIYADIWNSNSK